MLLELLRLKPWHLRQYARRMAKLCAEMHSLASRVDLPVQRNRLHETVRAAQALPESLKAKIPAAFADLPDGDRLCHGDFHPANILVTKQGERIIEYFDASLGNPLADLARTTIITLGAAETHQIDGWMQKIIVRCFQAAFIRGYFELRPGGEAEYRRWLPIIAAARLSEEIPELESWLLKLASKHP